MAREDWVMMSRIRNEARWIARNLIRTFQLCEKIVLWNDDSVDTTEHEVEQTTRALIHANPIKVSVPWGWKLTGTGEYGPLEMHWVNSPFRPAVREILSVSEIRDKQALWEYVKSKVEFVHVLCMDGDEMLSRAAMKNWPEIEAMLDQVDIIHFPFIYLWNEESQRRVDGIYGNNEDGLPKFRVPRAFTIKRVSAYDLFEQRFTWEGHRQGREVLGGFHCGSIPRENFRPNGVPDPVASVSPYPIIHFGYMKNDDRWAKYRFYNRIDPNNKFEGEYKHMVELPNIHAPGPTQFAAFLDEE